MVKSMTLLHLLPAVTAEWGMWASVHEYMSEQSLTAIVFV